MSHRNADAGAMEVKDRLEQIIHEIKFLKPHWELRPYTCQHCNRIALNHVASSSCDHLICEECCDKIVANECPVCQETIVVMWQHDSINANIRALEAHCAFKVYGCDEVIRLDEYMKHVKICKFSKGRAFATARDSRHNAKIAKLTDLKISTHFMKLEEKIEKMELQMKVMSAQIARNRPGPMVEFIHKFKNFQKLLDKHPETVRCETVFANLNYHLNVTLSFEVCPQGMCWWLAASVKCVQDIIPLDEQLNYRRLSVSLEDQVKKGRFDVTVSREQLPFEKFNDWMIRFERPLHLATDGTLNAKENPYVGQDSSIVIRLVIETFNIIEKPLQ